jgi:hypothetical protein
MFWVGLFVGLGLGPVFFLGALFLLRDVLPPTFFMPSDWD